MGEVSQTYLHIQCTCTPGTTTVWLECPLCRTYEMRFPILVKSSAYLIRCLADAALTPAYTTKSNLQSVIWPWVVESRLYNKPDPPTPTPRRCPNLPPPLIGLYSYRGLLLFLLLLQDVAANCKQGLPSVLARVGVQCMGQNDMDCVNSTRLHSGLSATFEHS